MRTLSLTPPALLAALGLLACNGADGDAATKTYSPGAYSAARVEGDLRTEMAADDDVEEGDVRIVCPSSEALSEVEVSGGDSLVVRGQVVADVDPCVVYLHSQGVSELEIDSEGDAELVLNGQATIDLDEVEANSLTVTVRGGADANLGAVTSDDVELDMGGGGSVQLDSFSGARIALMADGTADASLWGIDAGAVAIDATGSSEVEAEGGCDEAEVIASGSAWVDGSQLTAGDARIEASGSSEVHLDVIGTLSGSAEGSASVTVTGDYDGELSLL